MIIKSYKNNNSLCHCIEKESLEFVVVIAVDCILDENSEKR